VQCLGEASLVAIILPTRFEDEDFRTRNLQILGFCSLAHTTRYNARQINCMNSTRRRLCKHVKNSLLRQRSSHSRARRSGTHKERKVVHGRSQIDDFDFFGYFDQSGTENRTSFVHGIQLPPIRLHSSTPCHFSIANANTNFQSDKTFGCLQEESKKTKTGSGNWSDSVVGSTSGRGGGGGSSGTGCSCGDGLRANNGWAHGWLSSVDGAGGRWVAETGGEGADGNSWLGGRGVGSTGGVGGLWAVGSDTDGLELWLGGDESDGLGATLVEDGSEDTADVGGVVLGDTERDGGHADLLNEVGVLGVVEVHELVDIVHGDFSLVLGEVGAVHGDSGAAEQGAEELVQVGEESVLAGRGSVGGHVHHERSRSTVIEPVDGDGLAALVGGGKATVKVWEEVDGGAVDGARGEDTRNGDVGEGEVLVWHWALEVASDDNGVDENGQQGVLVGWGVVEEDNLGVVVANGVGSLSNGANGCKSSDGGETHGGGTGCLWVTGWEKVMLLNESVEVLEKWYNDKQTHGRD
jgi:hypothetical protein